MLGLPAALVSRLGSWPRFTARQLIRPIGGLTLFMAAASLLAGVGAHSLAEGGVIRLGEPLASHVPTSKHHAFLGDLWAHLTAYTTGFLGGVALCAWTLFRR